jgi:hypothetical protein
VSLTVRDAESLETLRAETVRRDLGEEDAIHGDHGDGGCPVLNGVSEALTMAVTTWTGGHVAEPPHHSKP